MRRLHTFTLHRPADDDAGQTTAEYALVLAAAAAVVAAMITWAGGGQIEELFAAVVRSLIDAVNG